MTETYIHPNSFDQLEKNSILKDVLLREREEILNIIIAAQLRGRGGAGFPTGMKWKLAYESENDAKCIICNADEGEPGTFKDRVLLKQYPELVIDGMSIAGYVIGASKGYIYLRGEYTYLKEQLEASLAERRRSGLLTADQFDIEIRLGAGAYICGEESALIESMEGYRGEPRDRPPFPTTHGFLNMPTIVDNVETFAWVTAILEKGPDWFNSVGTEKSKGYKLYSVSGDCTRPGVYEFEYGVTLQQILDIAQAENTKAVQVGGAAGHCIPSQEFQRTLSFEDISTSGSVIIFGHNRDMLDIALNFLEFFEDESCGQCTPCREGIPKLLEGVHSLQQGTCSVEHLNNLLKLADTMMIASKCGLGQSSPNALRSIVTHYKNEILGRARSN